MKWAKEIKGKSKEELATMLVGSHAALKNFRFGITGSKTKNVREGREFRKRIARIHTQVFAQTDNK